MVCPRCQMNFGEEPDCCPGCGYHFGRACEAFPFSPPPLALVMNPGGLVADGLEESLQGPYQALRTSFPQIDLSFCFVTLSPGTPLSEFGFWLFNAAPGAVDARAWHLLVTVDFASGQIALTPGYAIEPFVKSGDWTANLAATATAGSRGHWTEALEIFLHNARRILLCAWDDSHDRQAPDQDPS